MQRPGAQGQRADHQQTHHERGEAEQLSRARPPGPRPPPAAAPPAGPGSSPGRPAVDRSPESGRTGGPSRFRPPAAVRRTPSKLRPPAPGRPAGPSPGATAPPTAASGPRRARRCPRPAGARDRAGGSAPACPAPVAAPARSTGDPAAHQPMTPGSSSSATATSATETIPSSSTGTPRRAAVRRKPTPAARSAEPSPASRAIGSRRTVTHPGQRGGHHRGLVGQLLVVDPGAPTHDLVRRQPEGRGDQGGRRRGVADAHVAQDQQIRAGRDLGLGDGPARAERLRALRRRQRVLPVDRSRRGDVVLRDLRRQVAPGRRRRPGRGPAGSPRAAGPGSWPPPVPPRRRAPSPPSPHGDRRRRPPG